VRNIFRTTAYIAALDISPNGRVLACASTEGIIMWRLRDGSKKIFSSSVSHHPYSFIRFSRNGLYIAAVDSRNVLHLWNIRTCQQLARQEVNTQNLGGLRIHYHDTLRFWTVSSVGAEESQEEEILLFTGHKVHLLCIRTLEPTKLYFKPIFDSNAVAVSPDGRWVISSSKDVNVHIWEARDGLQQCSLLGHVEWTRTVDFNPMGNYLAVGNGKGVSLWRYRTQAN
jgi:WD40 repeat protein